MQAECRIPPRQSSAASTQLKSGRKKRYWVGLWNATSQETVPRSQKQPTPRKRTQHEETRTMAERAGISNANRNSRDYGQSFWIKRLGCLFLGRSCIARRIIFFLPDPIKTETPVVVSRLYPHSHFERISESLSGLNRSSHLERECTGWPRMPPLQMKGTTKRASKTLRSHIWEQVMTCHSHFWNESGENQTMTYQVLPSVLLPPSSASL